MDVIETFFYDTYAFFEVIEGKENYIPYSYGKGIITTRLNLMELYYGLMSKYGKEKADYWYDFLLKYAVEISDKTFKSASVFRLAHKNQNLSYVDCIGYIISKERNIKFLTGDKEFKDMDNVEFVK